MFTQSISDSELNHEFPDETFEKMRRRSDWGMPSRKGVTAKRASIRSRASHRASHRVSLRPDGMHRRR
jgi:hypothetical protein